METTLSKLAKLLADNRGVDAAGITEATTFVDDLKLDSLDMVDMIMQISDEFGVDTDSMDPTSIKNVGDLVKFIDSK